MARLLFFGKLSDVAGARERDFVVPEKVSTVSDLIDALRQGDEYLGAALSDETVSIIVNEARVSRSFAISADDEVAFLPPVSGG